MRSKPHIGSIFFIILISLALLAFGSGALADEPSSSHGSPAHSDTAAETPPPEGAHGDPAAAVEGGAPGGESAHGEGGVLGLLEHHLMDSRHYQFFGLDISLPILTIGSYQLPVTKHTIMLITAGILLVVILAPARKIKSGAVPHGLANFFELIILFIRDDVVYPSLGEQDGRKYLPYFLTAFFFVLFSNLLGMIPYGSTPTGNISVTGALAGISLLVMIGSGIVRHGPLGYLGSFVPHGVPIFVAPILFPIEIIGVLVKHFALCIRLFANMLAGHAVITVFLGLISSFFIAPVSILGAVAISLLELFIAFLQAYIFTMLSSLFIGSALHPEH